MPLLTHVSFFKKILPPVVVIKDHFALPILTGPLNPLFGPPTSPAHPRFLPMSDAYSPSLRRLAFLAAHGPAPGGLALPRQATAEGTYAWVSGPTYESGAEARFLQRAGADVVGMSTIPEVVACREEGMDVLVLSLVTNEVVMSDDLRSVKEEVEAEVRAIPVLLFFFLFFLNVRGFSSLGKRYNRSLPRSFRTTRCFPWAKPRVAR
jgi:purine-nucleoside phosphorylase